MPSKKDKVAIEFEEKVVTKCLATFQEHIILLRRNKSFTNEEIALIAGFAMSSLVLNLASQNSPINPSEINKVAEGFKDLLILNYNGLSKTAQEVTNDTRNTDPTIHNKSNE